MLALLLLRLLGDVARLGQRYLGEHGAEQLIDQHGEEDDVPDYRADIAQLHDRDRHSERHARLGQQRHAEVAGGLFVAFRNLAA